MNNKEALETLKSRYEDKSWIDILDHVQDTSVWQNAIESLEKQVPKKPTRVAASEGCYLCPTCGSKRISNMTNDRFCRDCGQAIDWSNE